MIYSYVPKLDIRELRIINIGIAQIKTTDKEFKPFKIPICDIVKGSRDTHTKIKNSKGEETNIIDQITDNLMERKIKINNGKFSENWIKIHMVQWCKYNNKGYIEILFSPEMSQFLLQLNKGKFTQLDLNIIYKLKNHYTIRLYEILKNKYDIIYNTKKKYLRMEIIELSSKLGAKGSYLKWNKFREKILKPSQKLFKKYSDLIFSFKASAENGRAYDTIIIYFEKNEYFTAQKNDDYEKFDNLALEPVIHKKLTEKYELSKVEALKCIEYVKDKHNENWEVAVSMKLKEISKINATGKILNIRKYTLAALKGNDNKKYTNGLKSEVSRINKIKKNIENGKNKETESINNLKERNRKDKLISNLDEKQIKKFKLLISQKGKNEFGKRFSYPNKLVYIDDFVKTEKI